MVSPIEWEKEKKNKEEEEEEEEKTTEMEDRYSSILLGDIPSTTIEQKHQR